jgi:tetratricopeptide (TPR) repeat protein
LTRQQPSARALILALLAFSAIVYANHFQNDFHFDDEHTVVNNPYIRSLSNLPRIFTDGRTFSTFPTHQVYRPLVTASLAIDYWLGGGLKPLAFHASTFFWYLIQLALMFLLFDKIFELAAPDWEGNRWAAAFAAALYGAHPAMAETVNYIIQRGDLYSTLGVVAGLYLYAAWPPRHSVRRFHLYLIPMALAQLSKPPALVFPVLLFAYIRLFEREPSDPRPIPVGKTFLRILPSLFVTVALLVLQARMVAATYAPTIGTALAYRITQPYVAAKYAAEFFLPLWLSADTDLTPFTSAADPRALLGYAAVIVFIGLAWLASRRPQTRPIAFGWIWFLVTLAPTSLFPLAEVENDHRMFFSFVGLAMAIAWTVALALRRWAAELPRAAVAGVAVCVLCAYGWGAHVRNQVWHTDEGLWLDVTGKSPKNGRGLMNYGLTQMAQGKSERALDYFERALAYTPNYFTLEINLGIANGELNRDAEAERHFFRAIQLAPNDSQTHFYHGRWLWKKGRAYEALLELKTAAELNPASLDPRYLEIEIYAAQGNWPAVTAAANQVLALAPADPSALQYLARARTGSTQLQAAEQLVRTNPTPENFVDLSLLYHQSGRYQECIDAARQAINLRPNYPEAWNNIAAAYEATSQWSKAVEAAREAVRLKPDFQLAKNNLAYSESQLALAKH